MTRKHEHKTDGERDGRRVLALERIEEELVPAVDRERGAKIGEQEEEDGAGQNPGAPSRLPAPIARRKTQETLRRVRLHPLSLDRPQGRLRALIRRRAK